MIIKKVLGLQGASGGGGDLLGMRWWRKVENGRSRLQASKNITDDPPDPHWLCLWIPLRLAMSVLSMRAIQWDP
eukprot:scaffold97424_cov15-Tisochrysis_lutea.AAC.1